MKAYFLLIALVFISGCETMQVAKRDFHNFNNTIIANAKCKAVYNSNQF
jgi:hypothetical protein